MIVSKAQIWYTTPMRILFSVGLLTLLMVPGLTSAQSYMGPEEVFLRDYQRINSRSAQQKVSQQQQQSNSSARPSVTPWWEASSSSAPAVVASSSSSAPVPTYQGPVQDSGLDPVTLRWLARLQSRQVELEVENRVQQIQHSTALYSGAPLTGSGLASNLVIAVVACAVGFTLYRVRQARKLLD